MAQSATLTKQQIRANKAQHRARKHCVTELRKIVDVACVIHGKAYDWTYVERLRNMVSRNISLPVRMHVWTEHDRSVPPDYVKHCLEDWPDITGPKKSWWYKMQMFDPQHHRGDLLYFDLDTVICGNLDWLLQDTTEYMWTLRDFRYLHNHHVQNMNSSVMWWNTEVMSWVWAAWQQRTPQQWAASMHGDQDFLYRTIDHNRRRYYPDQNVQSWRWSAHDGGWDFQTRRPRAPGTGTKIASGVSILVFHGRPKPHQTNDPMIRALWI